MTPQALLVLLAWPLIVFYLFTQFPSQRAVLIGFIVAWLFLPERAGFVLAGIPDYYKMSATCYGILLATCIFDFQRFSRFKFGWLDWPMLIYCLSPFASSLSNNLGAYDGIAQVLEQTMTYGIPYFLGRIYFNSLTGLRQLAIGMFIGGLVYVPLCLFENRFSPQLHQMVYGYSVIQFLKNYRLGGYRPTVFMSHGLTVGMWMMAAALIGVWLWQAKVLRKLWDIPIIWPVLGLLITFALVRSTGAYLYFVLGITILFVAKWLRSALPLMLLIIIISSYLSIAATGNFSVDKQGSKIINLASNIAGPERAQSLEFRWLNEELLIEKARERMILGWGGWGRSRLYTEDEAKQATTDSLWIIIFGDRGIVGLSSIFASSLLPAFVFCIRYPARTWLNPKVAPAAALAVVITLYMLDCTVNAKLNPIFTLASGAIAGLLLQKQENYQVKSQVATKIRNQQQHVRLLLARRSPQKLNKHRLR